MAMTEEDAVGVGTVAAGWEDEDDETEDYVGQQELGASVENGRSRDKRRRRTVNEQMVSYRITRAPGHNDHSLK
jgi:hypothetical protein